MNREEGRNPEDHPYLKCYFSLACSRCDPIWEKVAVIAEMDTNPKAKNNEEQ